VTGSAIENMPMTTTMTIMTMTSWLLLQATLLQGALIARLCVTALWQAKVTFVHN